MLNIESIYATYLNIKQEKNKEKYKNYKGWHSASQAGSCFKKLALRAEGKVEPPMDNRVMRLLRLGTIVHSDIENSIKDYMEASEEYKKSVNTIYTEKRVEIPEFKVLGHLDIAIESETTSGNKFAKVVDVKTCGSYPWKMKFGRKPDPNANTNYNLQLSTYAYAFAEEQGIYIDDIEMSLFWYNKDTSAIKEVMVSNDWIEKALEYWEDLRDYTDDIESSDELTVGSYGVPMANWECRYCSFKDIHCKGI
jgi:CRISPR/Cas system-associated exonuclease Cas4 (RecB family)